MSYDNAEKETRAPSDQPASDVLPALRHQRITELEHDAVQRSDPWDATFTATTAGLFRLGLQMETRLQTALTESTVTDSAEAARHLKRLQPFLDNYLKVMRQADRFSQLAQRRTAPTSQDSRDGD